MNIINEFEARYLNLLTDFGFHKIFGTESNKDLLMDFLNQIIKEEGLITDIKHLNPEQLGNFETDRKAIFDIFCTTEKGEYFIVEMQKANHAFFRDRCIYYSSLPIQRQALRGDWSFRLDRVYLVAILDFVLFNEFEEDKNQIVEQVYFMRERTKTIFSNKLKFAFVELPKFRKTEEELKTHFDKWLYILKNLSKLTDRPISVQGGIFDKVYELSEIKRLKIEEMETYKKSVRDYYDVQLAMDYSREEGREEGIEKEKIDILQKCFKMDFPIEVIIELTGYTKEQISFYKTNTVI